MVNKILQIIIKLIDVLLPEFKNEASQHGIKETKEALTAFNEIGLFVAKRIKDGIDLDDALALYAKITADSEFQKIVLAAYEKYDLIPVELKDMDISEGLELVKIQTEYVEKYLDTFNI